MINKSKLILVSSAILIFTAISAIAQTTRVYVADSGSDANLCTKTAECRTIAKALTVVDDGGEVIITESGDYDTFSVSKSVTIAAAPGVNAGIVSTVQFAIVIGQQSPVDSVTLRNLNLKKNVPDANGTQAVYNLGGKNLSIDGCTFTGFGVGVVAGGKAGKLSIHDSTFRKNGSGIVTNPLTTEGLLNVVIDNCKFEHGDYGVYLGTKTYASIRNSVMSGNKYYGILLVADKNLRTEAVIDNCLLSDNDAGLGLLGLGISLAKLSRSTITQNKTYGILVGFASNAYSFQNNVINGNLTDVSGTMTPVSLK